MKDILLFGWFAILLVITGAVLVGSGHSVSTASAEPPAQISSGKCDSLDTVATVKELALQKIHGLGGEYLRGGMGMPNGSKISLSIDSFRKRGVFGDAGLSCAAMIKGYNAMPPGYMSDHYTFEISTEYTIESTTDGKTMVSARFRPN